MSSGIGQSLEKLGLPQYAEAFESMTLRLGCWRKSTITC
jgi:hypothetical protein